MSGADMVAGYNKHNYHKFPGCLWGPNAPFLLSKEQQAVDLPNRNGALKGAEARTCGEGRPFYSYTSNRNDIGPPASVYHNLEVQLPSESINTHSCPMLLCVQAVIGAGPAGLAVSRELLKEGHTVTIFEAGGGVGGAWRFDGTATDSDLLGLDNSRVRVHSSM